MFLQCVQLLAFFVVLSSPGLFATGKVFFQAQYLLLSEITAMTIILCSPVVCLYLF